MYPVRGSRASGHAPNELEVALLHRRRERVRAILALRVGIRRFVKKQLHLLKACSDPTHPTMLAYEERRARLSEICRYPAKLTIA